MCGNVQEDEAGKGGEEIALADEKKKRRKSVAQEVGEILGIPPSPEQRKREKALEKFQKQLDKVPMVPIKRLHDWVNETIEVGRKLGIPDTEIGDMMRPVMRAAGYADRTIRDVLPQELKHSEKIRFAAESAAVGNILLPNANANTLPGAGVVSISESVVSKSNDEDEEKSNDEIWQINPADYSLDDLERYDKPFLIRIIRYLHDKLKEATTIS